jgi:hypothetical protein
MAQQYGSKIITDNLKFSFDPADLNSSYTNLDNTDIVTEFYNLKANNAGNEETLELGNDPWGKRAVLDRSLNNDATSNYDGGDVSNVYDGVDHTKKYRFTYFFRVDRKGSNGTLYFGLYGYNSSSTNIAIRNNGGASGTTNPYFAYPSHADYRFDEGKWYMFVAYVHPSGSTNPTDDTAGFYDMVTGTKVTGLSTGNVSYNAVWDSTHTKTRYRYYLYYSTDSTVAMSWHDGRIEVVDGNEPTITEMLNQCPDRLINGAGVGYVARSRNGLTYNSGEKSLSFNGSNGSHLITPATTDLDITGDMTVESWVYMDSSMNANFCCFMSKRDSSDNTNPILFWFEDRGSQNSFRVGWGGGSSFSYIGSNNNFNGTWAKWDHLVGTIEGTAMKLYVNGSLDTSGTYSGTRQTNTIPLRFGGVYSWYTENYMLTGRMAGMKIYSKALSASEVLQNYNAQKARFGL